MRSQDHWDSPNNIKWDTPKNNLEQGSNSNILFSNAVSAPIRPVAPQDHGQTNYRAPLNGFMVIWRFYG